MKFFNTLLFLFLGLSYSVFSQKTTNKTITNGRFVNTTYYNTAKNLEKKPSIKNNKISNLISGSTLVITISSTNATCYGSHDGTATATVAGGFAPYNFFWLSSQDTTSTITNLSAGQYQLIVLDSYCSIDTASVTITEPPSILYSVIGEGTTCNNCDGGAVVLTATPGSYNYLWSNGATTDTLTNLCGGLYTGVITNLSGCSENYSAYVVGLIDSVDFLYEGNCELDIFTFYPTYINPYDVSIDYHICSNPTSWLWDFGDPLSGIDNSSTLEIPDHLFTSNGTYIVKLIVNGAVAAIKTVDVYSPTANFISLFDCLTPASASFIDNSQCAQTYLWDFGDPTTGALNYDSAPFTQHVFSTNSIFNVKLIINPFTSNADTTSQVFNSNSISQINLGNDTVLLPGASITLNATSVVGSNYFWNTGDTTPSIQVDSAGIYNVFIENNSNCFQSDEIVVLYCLPSILNIQQLFQSINISVFPSPTKDKLTIEIPNLPSNSQIFFYNVFGRIIYSQNIIDIRTIISCGEYASGIYFYKIACNENIISNGKFIKE